MSVEHVSHWVVKYVCHLYLWHTKSEEIEVREKFKCYEKLYGVQSAAAMCRFHILMLKCNFIPEFWLKCLSLEITKMSSDCCSRKKPKLSLLSSHERWLQLQHTHICDRNEVRSRRLLASRASWRPRPQTSQAVWTAGTGACLSQWFKKCVRVCMWERQPRGGRGWRKSLKRRRCCGSGV